MKLQHKILRLFSSSQLIVTAAMLLLLPLLAALQYRWLGQLSAGEREQMRAHLQTLATHFSEDFNRELTRAYVAFAPDGDISDENRMNSYVAKDDRWRQSSAYPDLVKTVFLALTDDHQQLQLHCLNRAAHSFEPCAWPPSFAALRRQWEEPDRGPRGYGPPPNHTQRDGNAPPHRPEPPGHPLPSLIGEPPALVMTFFEPRPEDSGPGPPRVNGFAVIELDESCIRQELLPALLKRHFMGGEGSSYDLAIVNRERVVYKADGFKSGEFKSGEFKSGEFKSAEFKPDGQPGAQSSGVSNSLSSVAANADASVPLFNLEPGELRLARRSREDHGERFAGREPGRGPGPPLMPGNFGDGSRFGQPGQSGQPGLWQVHIRHRAGSLEAAVESVRRRNLLISFGILALLAASVALLTVSAQRARRLAAQQMDFVAGASHELRTPLAVIETAAYNLDKGVIKTPQQVQSYGALIRKEAGRLKEMVEQMLEFAGAQAGHLQYNLQPADLNQILSDVLASIQPLLTEGGFKLTSEIAPDLPPVLADAAALARALHNLLNNAMKYGGESKLIEVRACAVKESGGTAAQITVTDRGLGIPAAELSHVFEPFYRGSQAKAAQIHGNGLGLSLVKHIITAHSGTITVKSAPGAGTSFTVTLPAAFETAPISNQTSTLTDESPYEQAHPVGRR